MIIWINGSFGVGKTTIAQKLNKKLQKSIAIHVLENTSRFRKHVWIKKINEELKLWQL